MALEPTDDARCMCRGLHLRTNAFRTDGSLPGGLQKPCIVTHHLGLQLFIRSKEDRAGYRTIPFSSSSSTRRSQKGRSAGISKAKAASQRTASEYLEADFWELQEPLGLPSSFSGTHSQADVDAALLRASSASSSADPFQEQDGDPALAERRIRSLSGSASTSGRSSASSRGEYIRVCSP